MINEDNTQLVCSHCSSRIDMKKGEDRARTERGHFSKNEDTSQPNEVKFFPWAWAKSQRWIDFFWYFCPHVLMRTLSIPSSNTIWAGGKLKTERTYFNKLRIYKHIMFYYSCLHIRKHFVQKVSSLQSCPHPNIYWYIHMLLKKVLPWFLFLVD